jgi:hypothetical protein
MKLHERFERRVEFGPNPLRSAQIHLGSTEVKPRWIWTTRGEFEQHLARSQGSKARLNSPRRIDLSGIDGQYLQILYVLFVDSVCDG